MFFTGLFVFIVFRPLFQFPNASRQNTDVEDTLSSRASAGCRARKLISLGQLLQNMNYFGYDKIISRYFYALPVFERQSRQERKRNLKHSPNPSAYQTAFYQTFRKCQYQNTNKQTFTSYGCTILQDLPKCKLHDFARFLIDFAMPFRPSGA